MKKLTASVIIMLVLLVGGAGLALWNTSEKPVNSEKEIEKPTETVKNEDRMIEEKEEKDGEEKEGQLVTTEEKESANSALEKENETNVSQSAPVTTHAELTEEEAKKVAVSVYKKFLHTIEHSAVKKLRESKSYPSINPYDAQDMFQDLVTTKVFEEAVADQLASNVEGTDFYLYPKPNFELGTEMIEQTPNEMTVRFIQPANEFDPKFEVFVTLSLKKDKWLISNWKFVES
ncbi:MAG TPA: hypothetical protein VEY51_13085 [Chondromyces sp.]|nr:hypothetical protein [Chondromyces sp.]